MSSIVRRIVCSAAAPAPVGAYSQAVIADRTMYISGQIGMDPTKGNALSGDVATETEQSLVNMRAILKDVGADLTNVVKTTVLLADIADFPTVNTVYSKFFPSRPPARAMYQAAALPKGARVEIEAIAVLGELEEQ